MENKMKTECPHCGKKYRTVPENIGQQMKCHECGNDFKISNAALSPCPDCFALISKRAFTCPGCGAPLRDKEDSIDDIANEQLIGIYHPSAMHYFGIILLGIITLPILIGLFLLIGVMINIKFTEYKLTTCRIIVTKGFLSKEQNEIRIKDMRGVDLAQSLWQRIGGIGNIAIGTAASAGTEIMIAGIADPNKMVEEINSLR